MRILGIDPGSVICGYGVIEEQKNSFVLIEYGVVSAKKKSNEMGYRLKEIFERLTSVIERTRPDVAAYESMFFSKNVQSLIKLSQARAVAILAATMKDLEFNEYSPREVKKSVTGNGNAGKEQVQYMMMKMLNIKETPELFDSTDALAVAVCHSLKSKSPAKSASSWAEYIKKHPNRVIR